MVFTRKHGDFHGRAVSLPEGNMKDYSNSALYFFARHSSHSSP